MNKFTEDQILSILSEFEVHKELDTITNKYGITKATFQNWQKLKSIGRIGVKRCPIHDEPLIKGQADVYFGFVRTLPDYENSKSKSFPYSRSIVIRRGRPRIGEKETVNLCPSCREADIEWQAVNGTPFTKKLT